MEKSNLKWEELEAKISSSQVEEEKLNEIDEELEKVEIKKKPKKEKIEKENIKNVKNPVEGKKYNKKIILSAIILGIVILILAIFSTIFALINMSNTKIVKGVKIDGIDVSGLSKEEAKEKIESAYNE